MGSPFAGVDQEEGAGAVGVLCGARGAAALAEQRGLLIAGDPRDRERHAEVRRVGLAHHAARRHHVRQQAVRNTEQREQLGIPSPPVQRVQQRAGRVGVVGDERPAAGKARHQPGVHRPGGKLAAPRAGAGLGVAQEPLELGRGEVGIGHQARPLREQRREPGLAQHLAPLARAPVLPHDGAADRLERAPVPEHYRLPLVGDADASRALARGRERVPRGRERDGEDVAGIVLHPPGPREVLRKLPVPPPEHGAVLVHDKRGGTGGALIEGENGGHGYAAIRRPPSLGARPSSRGADSVRIGTLHRQQTHVRDIPRHQLRRRHVEGRIPDRAPAGAVVRPPIHVTSSGERSSIGMAAPVGQAKSKVERGAAT